MSIIIIMRPEKIKFKRNYCHSMRWTCHVLSFLDVIESAQNFNKDPSPQLNPPNPTHTKTTTINKINKQSKAASVCFGEGIYLWSDGSSVSGHSLFKYWFASFCRACKRGSEKQKQRWPFTFDTTPHFTRLFFTEDALRGLWPSLTLSYKPAGGQSTKRQTLLYHSGTE